MVSLFTFYHFLIRSMSLRDDPLLSSKQPRNAVVLVDLKVNQSVNKDIGSSQRHSISTFCRHNDVPDTSLIY